VNEFARHLQTGKTGESVIAGWLRSRGNHVLPVYEIAEGQYKGPQLYTCDGHELIAPDILAIGGGKVCWVEAKNKSAFSWHRKTRRFVTGIDLHHFEQYRRVAGVTQWPVWLLFLQRGGKAKDSPESPAGLYGGEIMYLSANINHTHKNHGKSGMVYWAEQSLTKLAAYPLPFAEAAA